MIFTNKLAKTLSGLALALAFTSVAQATPVDWTADLGFKSFKGRSGTYNNSLIGTFTYDADTSTLSNVNMVYTYQDVANNLTASPDNKYVSAGQIEVTATSIKFCDLNSVFGFALNFTDSITNAGGVINPTSVTQLSLTSSSNLKLNSQSGTLTGVPQATATAVPEPEAYAMMLAGLGLVGFAARRKQQAA